MDTFANLLLARAGDSGRALVAGDEEWTWRQLVAAGGARAAWLAERRGPGSVHGAPLRDNAPEHVLWLAGAAMAGAVVVGGNSTHRGTALARDLAHTECQLLVTDRAP